MVIALKDLKGRQMDYGRFRFSWTISENEENAYSARTAHPFQRNGAPFRFKLSKAQQVY